MFEKTTGHLGDITRTSGTSNYAEPVGTQAAGHIAQHSNELERLSMMLGEEIGSLESRLTPFLRAEPPPPTGNSGQTPTPIMAPFAESLGEINQRLLSQVHRVRSLTARIDI